MAAPEIISGQRDFSAGQVDTTLARADDLPLQRAGGRQMRDWHVRATRTVEQRPGRTAMFVGNGRVDRVRIASGNFYRLHFTDGALRITADNGVLAASAAGFLWTHATVQDIVWDQAKIDVDTVDIIITFPGMRPLVARYTISTGIWVIAGFAFAVGGDNIPLVPFYRVAAPGATMAISAAGPPGALVNIAFSAPVLKPEHVGAIFQWANRRMLVQTYVSAVAGTALLYEQMLPTQTLNLVAPDGAALVGTLGFALGEVVRGSASEAEGEVVGINSGAGQITVQLLNYASGFLASAVGPPEIKELIVGPHGKAKCTVVTTVGPAPIVSWNEQAISDARGWPRSVSSDQQRLIFCDLPAVPGGVIWSATNQPYNLSVGTNATDGMMEVIAGSPRVFHVMPWSDQIVFTDSGIHYVPIGETNPLRPGSVSFPKTAPDACSSVRPVLTIDGYLYVNAARAGVAVLVATGAALAAQRYRAQDITQFHSALFAGQPKAIAVGVGTQRVPERHIYVVNSNGSLVTGQLEAGKQWVGWVPWSGTINWVSAYQDVVTFVSAYQGVYICEDQNATFYLDSVVLVNGQTGPMAPPLGRGPFWWRPSGTVHVMLNFTPLGEHAVDHLGFIVPNYPGEDLTLPALVAGSPFTPTFEPFFPNAQPGTAQGQRTTPRNANRLVVTVQGCAGLVLAQLYSGAINPNRPPPGSVTSYRRIPAWFPIDNPTVAPPLRDGTYRQRFNGRDFDPRFAVLKDVPGPVKLVEVGIKGSV